MGKAIKIPFPKTRPSTSFVIKSRHFRHIQALVDTKSDLWRHAILFLLNTLSSSAMQIFNNVGFFYYYFPPITWYYYTKSSIFSLFRRGWDGVEARWVGEGFFIFFLPHVSLFFSPSSLSLSFISTLSYILRPLFAVYHLS